MPAEKLADLSKHPMSAIVSLGGCSASALLGSALFAASAQDLYRARAPETVPTRLGDASYSAYLLHPIIIVIASQVVLTFLGTSIAAELILMAIVLGATAIASIASMRFFEKPTAEWIRAVAGRVVPTGRSR